MTASLPIVPDMPAPQTLAADYWEKRKNTLYYQVFRILASGLAKDAQSILDVGTGGCPYLDWFPDVPVRVSIDVERPYESADVKGLRDDFLQWQPDQSYDVVTCLQVLEHIEDANAFARKLMAAGKTVIVSVPYKWPAGKTLGHIHDPVDENKMLTWFGKAPNFSYICHEITADVRRLIHVYEPNNITWTSLNNRTKRTRQHNDI